MDTIFQRREGIRLNKCFLPIISDLKKKVSAERRKELESLNVVSTDESAAWLIDYWCGKDFRRLVQMPFSRHWIMYIEAALRIAGKLGK